ncbi:MAG: AraC family transcriptional regulator [Clostridia bacterium]|nr:AraC family transcriptional regulator [Clostridia bacterium]
MKNSVLAYEQKRKQLIRIYDIEFDFLQHVFPDWYPIMKDTRLCCHYHLHERIEVIVVDEGCVTFQVNGRQYELFADDVLFINPFEPHSAFIPRGCNRTVYHAINLDPNSLKEIPCKAFQRILDDLTNGKKAYSNVLPDKSPRKEILSNLKGLISGGTDPDELHRLAHMFHFFSLLGEPFSMGNEIENKRSSAFIKTVVLYIQNTPPQEISLETIVSTLAYNKAYFTTLFKKNFSMTFTDYVNNYKIELAKGYIRNGNYNLNEVAANSGFNYYAYFFKKFKVITGISPSDFVEQCRLQK